MSNKITLLSNYIGIVQNTSLDFYLKSTNLLDTLENYLAEINENIKFSKSLVTTNVLSSFGELYNKLNETDFTVPNYSINGSEIEESGDKTLSNEFKLYFIEKYLSLSKEYRLRVDSLISNNKYFVDFSDDIGYIADTNSILDNNVLPYFDVFNQQYFYSQNAPNTIYKKISKNEKLMLKTFSFYCDALLKINLIGLQNSTVNVNTARTAHGQNLITDILYYNRAVANQQNFLAEIQTLLGEISEFVYFFKNLNLRDKNPDKKAVLMEYNITNLENLLLRVDSLKNNISKISLSTQQVLAV
jgi:hypothetical protein